MPPMPPMPPTTADTFDSLEFWVEAPALAHDDIERIITAYLAVQRIELMAELSQEVISGKAIKTLVKALGKNGHKHSNSASHLEATRDFFGVLADIVNAGLAAAQEPAEKPNK